MFAKQFLPLLLAATAFSVPAFADVTGKWQGSGQWDYDGSAVPCLLTMNFVENATSLQRQESRLDCDLVTMYSDPLTWSKDGPALVLNGTPAGSWDVHGFKSKEMANDQVEVETEFNVLTGKYLESWRKLSDGSIVYKIDAKLIKK